MILELRTVALPMRTSIPCPKKPFVRHDPTEARLNPKVMHDSDQPAVVEVMVHETRRQQVEDLTDTDKEVTYLVIDPAAHLR